VDSLKLIEIVMLRPFGTGFHSSKSESGRRCKIDGLAASAAMPSQ
jgi:hypothetical protein